MALERLLHRSWPALASISSFFHLVTRIARKWLCSLVTSPCLHLLLLSFQCRSACTQSMFPMLVYHFVDLYLLLMILKCGFVAFLFFTWYVYLNGKSSSVTNPEVLWKNLERLWEILFKYFWKILVIDFGFYWVSTKAFTT